MKSYPCGQESAEKDSKLILVTLSICYRCSVTKLCLTLCDPMNFSTPGSPVLHYLSEFAQSRPLSQ